MALPLFALLAPANTLVFPGQLVWEGPHEKAKGAYGRRFQIHEGHIILTTWNDELHCVTYQTPLDGSIASDARNAHLFGHYGEGKPWRETLDNDFGKSYRCDDNQRFALWSYAMDFNTFGTMAFHAVMW
jgi:hypothetical protein